MATEKETHVDQSPCVVAGTPVWRASAGDSGPRSRRRDDEYPAGRDVSRRKRQTAVGVAVTTTGRDKNGGVNVTEPRLLHRKAFSVRINVEKQAVANVIVHTKTATVSRTMMMAGLRRIIRRLRTAAKAARW